MKIALTSRGNSLADPVDPRFGRAKTFLIVDEETGDVSVHDNTLNLEAVQGAGIQAAQRIVELGASVVITGHIGPRAFRALQAAGVRVFLVAECTGQEAIDLFRQGKLREQTQADVEGHWS